MKIQNLLNQKIGTLIYLVNYIEIHLKTGKEEISDHKLMKLKKMSILFLMLQKMFTLVIQKNLKDYY